MSRRSLVKSFLIIITIIYSILFLIPQQVVHIENKYINRDIIFGGYKFSILNNKVSFDFSSFNLSPKIVGGKKTVLQAIPKGDKEITDTDLKRSKRFLSDRIKTLEVFTSNNFEVEIDSKNLVIYHPDISGIDDFMSSITKDVTLDFRQLKEGVEWDQNDAMSVYTNPEAWESTGLNQNDLQAVVPAGQESSEGGLQSFQVIFTQDGLRKFSDLAKNNLEKPVGLFLNDSQFPFAMPVVPEEFKDGVSSNPTVQGNLDSNQIELLNTQLRFKELPVSFEIKETSQINQIVDDYTFNRIFIGVVGFIILLLVTLTVLFKKYGFLLGFSNIVFILILGVIFKGFPVLISTYTVFGIGFMFVVTTAVSIYLSAVLRKQFLLEIPGLAVISTGFKRFWEYGKFLFLSLFIASSLGLYFLSGSWQFLAQAVFIGTLSLLFNLIVVTKSLLEVFGRGKK